MIITCKKGSANEVIDRLAKEKIDCVAVGEIVEQHKGIQLIKNEIASDVIYSEHDPYWAAFYKAVNLGWK